MNPSIPPVAPDAPVAKRKAEWRPHLTTQDSTFGGHFAPSQTGPQTCGPVGPGHVELSYGLDEFGLKPGEAFILANPLAAEP